MLQRLLRSRVLHGATYFNGRSLVARRTLIAAPKPGQGPLMERRSDRELPSSWHSSTRALRLLNQYIDIEQGGMRWMRTVPIFLAVLISSTLAIFNYQKSSSSVVSSTMYALRISPKAREYLGDEIYFAHKMPWIWGEMNQLHGKIDIRFTVKGKKNSGMMRFTSFRATRMGMFETTEWSLETKDGFKIDLLDGSDPFQGLAVEEEVKVGRGSYAPNLSG
jgi:cytochrome c oxidase assembly factor 1